MSLGPRDRSACVGDVSKLLGRNDAHGNFFGGVGHSVNRSVQGTAASGLQRAYRVVPVRLQWIVGLGNDSGTRGVQACEN